MKRLVYCFAIILSLVFLVASTATANVMEFDNTAAYGFSSYSEDGINLSVTGTPPYGPDILTGGGDNWLHIDGSYMTFNMGGSAFSLMSFDVLNDVPYPTAPGDAIIGTGSWSMAITLGVNDFSLISQLGGITSFYIDTDVSDVVNNHFEIDSITTRAAPVPEPSTFLLLGSGLAGLAFIVRRRKSSSS